MWESVGISLVVSIILHDKIGFISSVDGLPGGLSYLSSQYGWAVDSVVDFEVVLANGSIATASKTENVDLFNVLRGGGNNFGIVTTYTMKAYPMGGVSTPGQNSTDQSNS